MPRVALVLFCALLALPLARAQDSGTGAIRGTVVDLHDLGIPGASIAIVNVATGVRYSTTSNGEGRFAIDLLPPGDYTARVVAAGMSPQVTPQMHVDVGAAAELAFHLTIAGPQEKIRCPGSSCYFLLCSLESQRCN